ncbi:hypothetical protein JCM5296_005854 [Sporobolomyces johnsonii]
MVVSFALFLLGAVLIDLVELEAEQVARLDRFRLGFRFGHAYEGDGMDASGEGAGRQLGESLRNGADWTVDSLIGTDYFASGSMKYVKQVLGWAKAAGLYVILDLHAAPGKVSTAGFFSDANYERAYECLANWTTLAHTDDDFSTVVMIEVINCNDDSASCLTIQFMDDWWGAGNPSTHINTSDHIAYDDHNYAQWIVSSVDLTRAGYLSYLSHSYSVADSYPVITGEWSLSTIGGGELDPSSDGAQEFFQQFAAAQILNAEKGAGWVFWSWKTELNSATWGYWDAVQAGYIPENLATLNTSVCDGYIS